MDMKKWLKLQEIEATNKRKDPTTYVADGVEYDIMMSQKFGDEWFFKLVNGEWDEIVPGLCIDSAVYAMATDCIVNLYLGGLDEESIQELVKAAIAVATDIQKDIE